MGIFGALSTAVTGMRAQSFALENISGNIANSQTTAYKREDTSFVDLIPDAIPSKQVGGNVLANSRSTNSLQGDIQTASIGTYMAINGGGFFVVEKPSGFNGNQPTFSGTDLYSRRGDFTTDQYGYLVNGAGYYLKGIPVDPLTGNLTGTVPTLLQFSNSFLPAEATTTIQYQANLPSYPLTPNHDTTVAQSELLAPAASYPGGDPRTVGSGGTGIVVGSDLAQFLGDSISGGAVTTYDSTGNAVNINLRWAKTDSALYAGTDTWNLFYETDSAATGATPAWHQRRHRLHLHQRPDIAVGAVDHAHRRDRQRHCAWQPHRPARRGGPFAICRQQRHGAGQPAAARRLPGRRAAIGFGQRQGPHRRHLFQQPHHRTRRGHACELQRPQQPEAARRRRLRRDRRFRRGQLRARPARSSARRWKARTPTSPTSSPS